MRKLMILALMGIAMSFNSVKAQKVYDFVSVEKQPEYPGGIAKFYSYLSKEIKYPEVAKKNKTQGKVFLSFTVEKNGQLKDVAVTRGLSAETDAEAIRVVKNSPNWNPGILKGKPVRVKYNLNVNFNLAPSEDKKASIKTSTKSPEYPGGSNKLYSYLAKNIKYPKQAVKDKAQGKVFVSFYVEKDGKITNAKVTKGISKDLDEEALRVIMSSPKWNPGIAANGRPERVAYQLPINFTLS